MSCFFDRLEVICIEDFDTDWVLNIHKPIEVVTVNAPTSIHNKPKMLKFLEELRQKARYVNVE